MFSIRLAKEQQPRLASSALFFFFKWSVYFYGLHTHCKYDCNDLLRLLWFNYSSVVFRQTYWMRVALLSFASLDSTPLMSLQLDFCQVCRHFTSTYLDVRYKCELVVGRAWRSPLTYIALRYVIPPVFQILLHQLTRKVCVSAPANATKRSDPLRRDDERKKKNYDVKTVWYRVKRRFVKESNCWTFATELNRILYGFFLCVCRSCFWCQKKKKLDSPRMFKPIKCDYLDHFLVVDFFLLNKQTNTFIFAHRTGDKNRKHYFTMTF